MVSTPQATHSPAHGASAAVASSRHHHSLPQAHSPALRFESSGARPWFRDKFVTVEECAAALEAAGLRPRTGSGVERAPAIGISSVGGRFAATGMVYSPFSGEWTLSDDTDVNYLLCASKP